MIRLYHHPLDGASRSVRLVLGEYGLGADLVEERVWERREAFLVMNPAGTLPVLRDGETGAAVCGLGPVLEFIDETSGVALGPKRLMPEDALERAETRRVADWFATKFATEVSDHVVGEKLVKIQTRAAPDPTAIRAGRANIKTHLAYIAYLMRDRRWLAGERLSYADLVAAAYVSCVDYLGEVPWETNEAAKDWYARVKSRPAFRPLLTERLGGLAPAKHYDDLDF